METKKTYIEHDGKRYELCCGNSRNHGECFRSCAFRKIDGKFKDEPNYCTRNCYLPRWFENLKLFSDVWLVNVPAEKPNRGCISAKCTMRKKVPEEKPNRGCISAKCTMRKVAKSSRVAHFAEMRPLASRGFATDSKDSETVTNADHRKQRGRTAPNRALGKTAKSKPAIGNKSQTKKGRAK